MKSGTTAAAMAAGRHRVGRITSHAPLLPLLPEEEEVVGTGDDPAVDVASAFARAEDGDLDGVGRRL